MGPRPGRWAPVAARSPARNDSIVDLPETRYTKTADGVHIACQMVGDSKPDLLWLVGSYGNLRVQWEQPRVARFFTKLVPDRCRYYRMVA